MRWKGLKSDRWDTAFAWMPHKCFHCHDWIWMEKVVVWKQYDKWQCQVCYVTTSIGGEKAWNPYDILTPQKPFYPTPFIPPPTQTYPSYPYPGASGGTTSISPQLSQQELNSYSKQLSDAGYFQSISGYGTSSPEQSSPTA